MNEGDAENGTWPAPKPGRGGGRVATLRRRAISAFRGVFRGGEGEVKPPRRVTAARPVWLKPVHYGQLVVFVHVPKAAGSSVNDVLWHLYGRMFHVHHERLSVANRGDMDRSWASGVLALSGHYPFGFHRMFGAKKDGLLEGDGLFEGREIKYVSVMREPAERLYSYYRYVSSSPLHRLHAETRGMDCVEFFERMEEIRNGECRNLQFAMISGGKRSLEEGIRVVERAYLSVVPVHGIAELLGKMERELEWPEGRVQLHRKNRSPERSHDGEMEFLREYARRNCPLDNGLYEYVVARFEEEFGKAAPTGA